MNIEISIKSLKSFGISADEFVYLKLIEANRHDVLVNLKLVVDLEKLQTKGYLKLGESVENHIVRSKFSNPNDVPFEAMWSELLSHFPLKVYVRGSVRVLRAKDPDAVSNKDSKKKYKKYIKDDVTKHRKVIDALQVELDIRRKGDQLGYMQMLSTWINQCTWEKYLDLDDPKDNERRITRQL